MTIKKRLFISNILMIVIPIIIAITTMLIAWLLLNGMTQGALYEIVKGIERDQELRQSAYLATIRAQLTIIALLTVTAIIAFIYFTNRLLTKYVFSKIEQPLDILSKGVHQIRDGNLDHRIVYYREDEFKLICEDFNEMAVRLKESVEQIQRSEQNRKELLASISHDIRSPLTSIKGFVEGLLDGVANTPETQREYLQIIKTKTDDINNMVSRLFLFSKMDMGEYPSSPEKLDIGKEISDFVAASREDYKEKGLLIEVNGILSGRMIYADPTHVRSIFTNLFDNSAKYKEKDTARAVVVCEAETDSIRIIFEDDGPGVPEQSLPQLFEVFYRDDPSRNNPQKGSGLGLAIVKKALERMRGRIYAENREEGGLRIVIEIPEWMEESQ